MDDFRSGTGPAARPPARRPGGRGDTLLAALGYAALTAIMTWPHVTVLATHAPDHQDIYFNLWRLRWIAHALARAPLDLFHGNIFHPEPLTLSFSDAILVEGAAAAPLFWLGLPPVLVHNLTLWAALVGSGAGMFVLIRHLTGNRGAAFAGGLIFTFAPYRFDHYMHMELQWALWIPWAFWALSRTIADGSRRHGLLTGVFVALQMLSSIYYGIFLATLLPIAGLVLLAATGPTRRRAALSALVPGAIAAAVASGAYAAPYFLTKDRLGGRGQHEIHTFSARPSSYLISTPDNIVWGGTFEGRSRPERRLFPGALALLLASFGLLLRRPSPMRMACLLGAVAAFELSLGFSGYSFAILHEHVPVYQGLRAMARAGLFVLFFVAVLAGYGHAFVASVFPARVRLVFAAAVVLVLLGEYRVRPLTLVAYPNGPPPLHAWLAEQPRGVVVELPMAAPEALPGPDPRYAYLSTFHWQPLLNGYSGFHPRSYLERAADVRGFPDERAIARLHADGARYLVVHLDAWRPDARARIRETLATRYGLAQLASFPGREAESVVFAVR